MTGGPGASAPAPEGPEGDAVSSGATGEARPRGAAAGPPPEGRSGAAPLRPAPRLPYRSPSLLRHGRLAETTRFGGSEILDSGGGLGQQL